MSETGATDTAAFIARWEPSGGKELANYQSFLIELCALLGVAPPEPTTADDRHNAYVFERSVPFLHSAPVQRPYGTDSGCPIGPSRLPGARQCRRDGDPFYQGAHRQADGAPRELGEAGLGQEGGGEASRMTPILHEPAKRFLLTRGRVCYFPLTRRSSGERR